MLTYFDPFQNPDFVSSDFVSSDNLNLVGVDTKSKEMLQTLVLELKNVCLFVLWP